MFYPDFDPLYLALAAPGVILALVAQFLVQSRFAKYSRIGTRAGWSGAEIAAAILRTNGITNVRIEPVRGFLSDHYDPRSRTLRLSPEVYQGQSIAATGIAAHEVGHAIQHANSFVPLHARSALVPFVNLGNWLAFPTLMIGFVLASIAPVAGQAAIIAGLVLMAVLVLFHVVTLPVEIDASRRAMAAIRQGRLLSDEEAVGARKVLTAAALTYVAAAASAALQLLYFLLRSGLLGGRRSSD